MLKCQWQRDAIWSLLTTPIGESQLRSLEFWSKALSLSADNYFHFEKQFLAYSWASVETNTPPCATRYHATPFPPYPGGSVVKNLPANAWDSGLIHGLGGFPGGQCSNPFQYSCLENPMHRGAWQGTVHGITRVGHGLVSKPPQVTWIINYITISYGLK